MMKPTTAHVQRIGVLLALYLCIGFLQFALLYPLHATMDLPTWDEANYMGIGEQYIHSGNLGPLSGSPLYALLYSAFIRAAGTVNSIFYMQYFVKISVSILLLLFLSTYLRSRLLVSLLAATWLVSQANVEERVLVYHVALGLFLLALVVHKKYPVTTLFILCLCTLTRLEYLFPSIAVAGYLLWKSSPRARIMRLYGQSSIERSSTMTSDLVGASLLAVLMIYVLLNLTNFNVGGKRTWFAFNQNYARHEVEAGRYHLNPYVDSNIVIQDDFPGANSLKEAFLINPRFFLKHLARNVAILPRAVFATLVVPYVKSVPFILLYGAIAGSVVTVLTLASVGKEFVRQLFSAVRNRKLLLYATLISLPALVPILLVYPEPHHTLIMVPFLLFWPGLVCEEALIKINVPSFTHRILLVLNVVFLLCVVVSAKPYTSKNGSRPVLEKINRLIELWPNEPVRFLGVGSTWYASYIGSQKVVPIEPLATVNGEKIEDGSGDLYALLKRYNPDIVLVGSELTGSKNFDNDSLAALRSEKWAMCPIGGDSFFFRRDKVNDHFSCSSQNPGKGPIVLNPTSQ